MKSIKTLLRGDVSLPKAELQCRCRRKPLPPDR